jgi:hypothetical protein
MKETKFDFAQSDVEIVKCSKFSTLTALKTKYGNEYKVILDYEYENKDYEKVYLFVNNNNEQTLVLPGSNDTETEEAVDQDLEDMRHDIDFNTIYFVNRRDGLDILALLSEISFYTPIYYNCSVIFYQDEFFKPDKDLNEDHLAASKLNYNSEMDLKFELTSSYVSYIIKQYKIDGTIPNLIEELIRLGVDTDTIQEIQNKEIETYDSLITEPDEFDLQLGVEEIDANNL